jgi:NADH-quinone oxidoreductase subunit J
MTLFYQFIFYFFGLVAVVSACVFVTRRSPVAAALWLVNVMFCLSALFVMLDAQFLGAIQVLVYAGAIMVVFLFVIMLLNLGQPGQLADAAGWLPRIGAGALAIAVLAGALVRLPHPEPIAALRLAPDSLAVLTATQGSVAPLATPLFTTYLLAFEVTSVLLLAAVIGAVVLGRRGSGEAAPDLPTAPAGRLATQPAPIASPVRADAR